MFSFFPKLNQKDCQFPLAQYIPIVGLVSWQYTVHLECSMENGLIIACYSTTVHLMDGRHAISGIHDGLESAFIFLIAVITDRASGATELIVLSSTA